MMTDNNISENMKSGNATAINIEQALSQLDGDHELLNEVIEIFVETLPELMEELQQAVTTSDASKLQGAAHSLKGSASNICAEPVRAVAQQLEEMGQRDDMDDVNILVTELQDNVSGLISFAATLNEK